MKTLGITVMAFVVAVQLLVLGVLALACNNAVLGFMVGIAVPEAFRMLPRMGEPEEGQDGQDGLNGHCGRDGYLNSRSKRNKQ